MKQLLLPFFTVLTLNVSSQTTYVPDNNFETFLENNGMGNGIPNDDYVTTANISGVGSLIVWGWNIADLTGIEDFTSLNTLYCFNNPLTTLNVTQNTFLNDLRCNGTLLTSLDVTQNSYLTTLFCYDNSLTSLDVTQNATLSDFRCFDNQITSLDVTQNPQLNIFFCNDNSLTSLNVTQNSQLSDLRCFNNSITSLDMSQNPQLVALFCYGNNLTSLDVSQTPLLDDLRCFDNQLISLDVSESTALSLLLCNDNLITSLDVSQNFELSYLHCYNNQLQCLSANNGQNITLDCTNNQLGCVSVLFPGWASANDSYDVGVTFNVVCQFYLDNDITQNTTSLTAVQNGATYQWLDCDNSYAIIGETNQTYTPSATGFFAVEITYYDGCIGEVVDTSSCHFVWIQSDVSLGELTKDNAELVKITDLMGREVPFKTNMVLIYLYSDGTIERVFELD